MDDIRKKAEYYCVRAQRQARSHYLTAKRNGRKHKYLGVPVVVISTIIGSAIFATISEDPAIGWKILTGLLSITAAVMAALQTFFKYSELAEKHRLAGAEYASIKRKLDSYKLRIVEPDGNRNDYLDALMAIIKDLDQLEKDSPDAPDDLYDQAVKEQLSDKEGL